MTGIHQAIAASGGNTTLMQLIQKNSLTSNLNLVLDAGDRSSFQSATDQTFYDVSGGGNNYFIGTTSGATATDPIFTGPIGRIGSSYFRFDGTDRYFLEASAHTYADNWHKANGAFTIVYVAYFATRSDTVGIFSNIGGVSGNFGINLATNASSVLQLRRTTGAGGGTVVDSLLSVPSGSWTFIALSYNEATTSATCRVNGTTQQYTGLAQSGAVTNADAANKVSRGLPSTNEYHWNNDRMACTAHWSRALTSTELGNLYTDVKAYFSGMP